MTWTRTVDIIWPRRLKRQDRRADIAAELRVHSGGGGEVGDQRGGRRFAVGAGDGDEGRAGRVEPPFAAEQFDVADHFDAGLSRKRDDPMRCGMGQRHAGREHQACDFAPVGVVQIGGGNSGRIGFRHACRIVVEGDDVGAAGEQRARARQSRAAEAENRDLFAGKGRDRDHDAATSISELKVPPTPARPRRSKNE